MQWDHFEKILSYSTINSCSLQLSTTYKMDGKRQLFLGLRRRRKGFELLFGRFFAALVLNTMVGKESLAWLTCVVRGLPVRVRFVCKISIFTLRKQNRIWESICPFKQGDFLVMIRVEQMESLFSVKSNSSQVLAPRHTCLA